MEHNEREGEGWIKSQGGVESPPATFEVVFEDHPSFWIPSLLLKV
jgi:hypothetical protein